MDAKDLVSDFGADWWDISLSIVSFLVIVGIGWLVIKYLFMRK